MIRRQLSYDYCNIICNPYVPLVSATIRYLIWSISLYNNERCLHLLARPLPSMCLLYFPARPAFEFWMKLNKQLPRERTTFLRVSDSVLTDPAPHSYLGKVTSAHPSRSFRLFVCLFVWDTWRASERNVWLKWADVTFKKDRHLRLSVQ